MGEQKSLGHYEMLWDCDHCGEAKGLLGKSQRYCANCGAQQNPIHRYFPKEGEEVRVDGHVYEGSDRTCPSCSNPMGAKAHNCSKCGAPLDGAAEVKGIGGPIVQPKKTSGRTILLVLAIIAAVIFAIWWFFFRTKSAEMKVTGHAWATTIEVVQFGPVDEEAWRDQVPRGAVARSCRPRERSTRQVDTGRKDCHTEKRDKKDGTFEKIETCTPIMRSEPVMDDWCAYTISRWTKVDTLKAAGRDLNPSWPTTTIPNKAAEIPGAKKLGAHDQTFTLELGAQRCDVKESAWRKYADGQAVKVEVRARSGALVCDSL